MRQQSLVVLVSSLALLAIVFTVQMHNVVLLVAIPPSSSSLSEAEGESGSWWIVPRPSYYSYYREAVNTTTTTRDKLKNDDSSRRAITPLSSSSSSYRDIELPEHVVANGKDSVDNPLLLLPLKILEQYRRWHGVEAIRREQQSSGLHSSNNNRTYAVGFYQCPLAAGNRMHEFANSLLWAIVTNRTFLWKYWDDQTCLKYAPDKLIEFHTCDVESTRIEHCDALLQRAEWIPSYDEWFPQVDILRHNQPVVLPAKATLPKPAMNMRIKNPVVVDSQQLRQTTPVAIFMRFQNRLSYLGRPEYRDRKLQTEWGRHAAQQLFSLGEEFLYGLLFRYCFDFSKSIRGSVALSGEPGRATTRTTSAVRPYSVALHSRHNESGDLGCNVENEKQCLQQVLSNNLQQQNRGCEVALLSDRDCTIKNLRTWLEQEDQRHCKVHVAQHDVGTGTFSEHGPFAGKHALLTREKEMLNWHRGCCISSQKNSSNVQFYHCIGAGFFQDLLLASRVARDAVVGSLEDPSRYGDAWRSSSNMLLEFVDYERKMDAWFLQHQGRSSRRPEKLPKLETCTIEPLVS